MVTGNSSLSNMIQLNQFGFELIKDKLLQKVIPSRMHLLLVSQGKENWNIRPHLGGFPGGAVVKNLPANAGDTGSSRGLGGSHMPRSN